MDTRSTSDEILVVALARNDEQYVVLYTERYRKEALRTLGRWAANPDLSFNWRDVAELSKRIRSGPTSYDRTG